LAPVPPTPLSWGRSPRTRAGPRPWKSARLRALPVAPFERDARARPTHPDDWKTPPAFLARSLPFVSSPIISGNFRGLRIVFGLPLAKAHAVPCSPWTGRPRRNFFSGGSSSSDAFGARSCCIRALRTRVGPGKPAEKSARLRALPVAPLSETPRAPGLTPRFFMGHPIRLETPLAFMRRTRFWIPVTSSANAALDTRLVLLRRATWTGRQTLCLLRIFVPRCLHSSCLAERDPLVLAPVLPTPLSPGGRALVLGRQSRPRPGTVPASCSSVALQRRSAASPSIHPEERQRGKSDESKAQGIAPVSWERKIN
jgi:hypothetical protein